MFETVVALNQEVDDPNILHKLLCFAVGGTREETDLLFVDRGNWLVVRSSVSLDVSRLKSWTLGDRPIVDSEGVIPFGVVEPIATGTHFADVLFASVVNRTGFGRRTITDDSEVLSVLEGYLKGMRPLGLEVGEQQWLRSSSKGLSLPYRRVRGAVEVTNPRAVEKVYRNGVGQGKPYGLGMLQLI